VNEVPIDVTQWIKEEVQVKWPLPEGEVFARPATDDDLPGLCYKPYPGRLLVIWLDLDDEVASYELKEREARCRRGWCPSNVTIPQFMILWEMYGN
jgi:hypothetical protein